MRWGFVWLLALVMLSSSMTARAQTPSPEASLAIQAAGEQARNGDAEGALDRLMVLRDRLGDDAFVDRAALSLYAGTFAQALNDDERALALFLEAADGFRVPEADYPAAAAVALEQAATVLYRLERPREAYDTLLDARSLHARTGGAVDAVAVRLARGAATIALGLGDVERVMAELTTAAELTLAADAADAPLVSANAAANAARLAAWLGAYPLAGFFNDTAGGVAASALAEISLTQPTNDPRQTTACNEFAGLIRELAALRIDIGDHGGAHMLLTMGGTASPVCGGLLDPRATLYENTLSARLFLRVGDPFSAHLRLRGYEEGIRDVPLPDAERVISDAVARARQAEARLALGFPGEAGELLARVPERLDVATTPTYERERLLALALKHRMDGQSEAALDVLATAEAFMSAQAPLHWFPRAEIVFRRALILIEDGAPDAAIAVRDGFEAALAELIESQRDPGRQMDDLLAGDGSEHGARAPGEDAAGALQRPEDEGRVEAPAFGALDRMRMLFDLSMAAHHGDEDGARAAFAKVAETGLPGDVGFAGHAQRAYLLACLRAKGAGLECSLAIKAAFGNPASVPYACVDGCDWIGSEAAELVVETDMIRRTPLISQFAEPVLAWLVHAADESAGRSRSASDDHAVAHGSTRSYEAGLAFEMIQHMVEGGAAAAVGQIGSRLAGGSGELADLMRERQHLAAQVDALFRGGEADPGEASRLAARSRELSRRLDALRPDHAELFDPAPMGVEAISASMSEGAAFLLVSSTGAATYVFAIRGGALEWHRAPLDAATLEERVSKLRASLDPEAANRGATPLTGARAPRIRAFDRTAAYEIYRALLEPFAGFLSDAELYVVAEGPLASLPLAVLVRSAPQGADDDPAALLATDWLMRAHPVTLLPTPAALRLAALQRQRPRAALPFIGFGDAVFSPPGMDAAPFDTLARLPGTRAEIRRLAELLGGGDDGVYLGAAATKAAMLDADLSRARVLAFATHGLLAGQMADATEPGLVFSHPSSGAGMGESYLTASEAATLRINADWVLLSACNTAGPDGRPDSQGLSGLARAFLFAGARSVLVSYWPVRDDAAMLLTTEALGWHESHPDASRASALRHAMVSLLDRTDTPDFAHPSAWAPFVLLGDG